MKQITWTLNIDTGKTHTTVGTFKTKRELVREMMAIRAPSTRITRHGHVYLVIPAKN